MKNIVYSVIFVLILPVFSPVVAGGVGGVQCPKQELFSPVVAGGVGRVTGLPIPRFMSTKSNESNVRIGPNKKKYHVCLILKQKVPLKILDEQGDWRLIEDWEGETGWIHKRLLTDKLQAIIIIKVANIYAKPSTNISIIAKAPKHVILPITDCDITWCKTTISSINTQGYIQKTDFWGSLK